MRATQVTLAVLLQMSHAEVTEDELDSANSASPRESFWIVQNPTVWPAFAGHDISGTVPYFPFRNARTSAADWSATSSIGMWPVLG